ncbi:MAG: cysteine desulfurase family protein [Acidobacteriota bacterium]
MRLPDGRIYLDCNATTPLDPVVGQVLSRTQASLFGNPSSPYTEGRAAREALEAARGDVASLVGCRPDEVVFTSSGTEANHLALRSAARSRPGRRRVILSAVEHPSVLGQWDALEALGAVVEEVPVDGRGVLDLESLEGSMGADVACVSVMQAHNETGVLQPLDSVGALCRRWGALFHTDAVQAAGKVPLRWAQALPDYLVVAAHKFYGPKGIAVLAVRSGAPVEPMLAGGGQERGRRASTEAVPLAAAMGTACRLASEGLARWPAVERLRDSLEERLRSAHGARVFGEDAPRLPNTSLVSLPGVDASALVRALDEKGVAVATGSACHSGGSGLPRVLARMGIPERCAGTVLRISLGRGTTAGDSAAFAAALRAALGVGS